MSLELLRATVLEYSFGVVVPQFPHTCWPPTRYYTDFSRMILTNKKRCKEKLIGTEKLEEKPRAYEYINESDYRIISRIELR